MRNLSLSKFLGSAVAIFAFAILIALILIFVGAIWQSEPRVQAAVIGVIASVIIASYTHVQTRTREIEARHFEQKSETYLDFVKALIDVIKGVKSGKDHPMEDLVERMLKFKQYAVVWGKADFLQSFDRYEERLGDTSLSNQERIYVMDDILRALRKDLGHNDSQLRRGEVMGLFLHAEERRKLLGK